MKKKELDALKKELLFKRETLTAKNGGEKVSQYAEGYKGFIDGSKTEREAVEYTIQILEKSGYKPFNFGDALEKGGRYYLNNRGKSICAFRIGQNDLEQGVKIVGAHIDSPRLDLKQNPLYEQNDMAFLKTHYYGGIRKYQWTTVPLALHGVLIKGDGTTVKVNIGDDKADPILCITDLLPHLAAEQSQKPLATAFKGEGLNILIGTDAIDEDADKAVKLNVLNILNQKYGITEKDFISAELCAVPALNARDLGLDRSLIAAYGHDDRVCAYPALTAFLESEKSLSTCLCILADKEEVGSDGVTGSQCSIFYDLLDEICHYFGANKNKVKMNSVCLSADVTAAYDPLYSDVYEKNNSTYINGGVAICKYTGSRGKSGTSDASAELVGKIRAIMDKNGIVWQTGELGRVDAGGGGTIAKYVANQNIDTIDVGVPVLSMHSPMEVISKKDIYETHKAFKCFYLD